MLLAVVLALSLISRVVVFCGVVVAEGVRVVVDGVLLLLALLFMVIFALSLVLRLLCVMLVLMLLFADCVGMIGVVVVSCVFAGIGVDVSDSVCMRLVVVVLLVCVFVVAVLMCVRLVRMMPLVVMLSSVCVLMLWRVVVAAGVDVIGVVVSMCGVVASGYDGINGVDGGVDVDVVVVDVDYCVTACCVVVGVFVM